MTDADPITDAVKTLASEQTYRDVGVASIHDTVERLILAKPALGVLERRAQWSTQLLMVHLGELPARESDLPRIGFFVALGHLGRRSALPVLAAYLSHLPDEVSDEVHHIDHPFRYALRSIERISGTSLGLGPGEDLASLFEQRHEIAGRLLANNRSA